MKFPEVEIITIITLKGTPITGVMNQKSSDGTPSVVFSDGIFYTKNIRGDLNTMSIVCFGRRECMERDDGDE